MCAQVRLKTKNDFCQGNCYFLGTALAKTKHSFPVKIMKTETILVENIKCGGCMNSIKQRLLGLTGVLSININKDESRVTIDHTGSLKRQVFVKELTHMGYPEVGSENSLLTQAKSYVSCAVGRLSEEK